MCVFVYEHTKKDFRMIWSLFGPPPSPPVAAHVSSLVSSTLLQASSVWIFIPGEGGGRVETIEHTFSITANGSKETTMMMMMVDGGEEKVEERGYFGGGWKRSCVLWGRRRKGGAVAPTFRFHRCKYLERIYRETRRTENRE